MQGRDQFENNLLQNPQDLGVPEITGFGSLFFFFTNGDIEAEGMVHAKLMSFFTEFLHCQLKAVGAEGSTCVRTQRSAKIWGGTELLLAWDTQSLKGCRGPLLMTLAEQGPPLVGPSCLF